MSSLGVDSLGVDITNYLWGIAIAIKIYDIQALIEDEPIPALFGLGLGDCLIFLATAASTKFFLKRIESFDYTKFKSS